MFIVEEEKKYFTAKEAREISDKISSSNINNELNWIYELINKARFDGKYQITFSNKTLNSHTINILKEKGFKVNHFSGCQWDPADDTTISW